MNETPSKGTMPTIKLHTDAEASANPLVRTVFDDIRATRAYREHLARVLVSRALTEAQSRA